MPVLDKIKEIFSSDKSSSSSKTAPAETKATDKAATTVTPAKTSTPVVAPHTEIPAVPAAAVAPAPTSTSVSKSSEVAFDAHKVKVIFVLGGPGAGTCTFVQLSK